MYPFPQYAMYGGMNMYGMSQAWMAHAAHKQESKFTEHMSTNVEAKTTKKKTSFTIDSILGNTGDEKNDSGFEENISPTGFSHENKKTFSYEAKTSPATIHPGPQALTVSHPQPPHHFHPKLGDNPMLFHPKYGFSPAVSHAITTEDYPTSPVLNMSVEKYRRSRTIFTTSQLEKLETVFEKQHYMVGSDRCQLAEEMNLSEAQVKVWFQNRRIKYRKQNKNNKRQVIVQ